MTPITDEEYVEILIKSEAFKNIKKTASVHGIEIDDATWDSEDSPWSIIMNGGIIRLWYYGEDLESTALEAIHENINMKKLMERTKAQHIEDYGIE